MFYPTEIPMRTWCSRDGSAACLHATTHDTGFTLKIDQAETSARNMCSTNRGCDDAEKNRPGQRKII